MAKEIISQHFEHPELGEIAVRKLSSAKKITARWKDRDLLVITVPPRITARYLARSIEDMKTSLLSLRPSPDFFVPGWTYITPEITFKVGIGSRPGYFYTRSEPELKSLSLLMPPGYNARGSEEFNSFVNNFLKSYARLNAAKILIPMANEIASRLGVKPSLIDISHGKKVLGHCNSRKEVYLSKNLIFYPDLLRRYVILHEFAHLTHMNHSRYFYALLDRYLGCSYKSLKKALSAHILPFK